MREQVLLGIKQLRLACLWTQLIRSPIGQQGSVGGGGVISIAQGVEANPIRSVAVALVITRPSNALINKNSATIVTSVGI